MPQFWHGLFFVSIMLALRTYTDVRIGQGENAGWRSQLTNCLVLSVLNGRSLKTEIFFLCKYQDKCACNSTFCRLLFIAYGRR